MSSGRRGYRDSNSVMIGGIVTCETVTIVRYDGSAMAYDVAVVGGTGPQGKGLAYRFAGAGRSVVIGSRSQGRATDTAAAIRERLPDADVAGLANPDAVDASGLVVLAVPYDGHDQLVGSLAGHLAGRIVVSCVNPLGFDEHGPYGLDVPAGSAAETTGRLVPDATVVGAFHHVSAVNLWKHDGPLEHEDVLVCGDDDAAKVTVIELARCVTGHDGVDAGRLRMARQLEPLTAVLVSVNKRYKTRSGISMTGIPRG